jgi:hypothetical protein
VNLDAKEKDFFNAWEKQYWVKIDDYLTSEGEQTVACQDNWIIKLPKVLFFHVNRVQFDTDTKELKKVHTPFKFEKVISVDRFLNMNRGKSEVLR